MFFNFIIGLMALNFPILWDGLATRVSLISWIRLKAHNFSSIDQGS